MSDKNINEENLSTDNISKAEITSNEIENDVVANDEIETEFVSKEKKPNKKLGIICIGIIVTASVIATICAIINPVNIVHRSIVKAECEYSSRASIVDAIALPMAIDMIDNKSVSVDGELNIDENSYMPSINGGGISFSFDKDIDKKLAQSKISGTYKNTALMDIFAYTNDDDIVLYAPTLFEKAVKFKTKDVMKQYYESPLMEGSSAEYNENNDFSINLFSDNALTEKKDLYLSMYSNFKRDLTYYTNLHWKTATKNAKLIKGENTDIKVGDNSLNCTLYTLIIPSEQANQFIGSTLKDLSASASFETLVTEYANYMYSSQPMYQYFFPNQKDLETYIKESVAGVISNIENNAKFGNMKINFYINKGLLIKCSLNTNVAVDQSIMDINCNVAVDGQDNPVDTVNSELSFNSDGSVLKLSFSDKAKKIENAIEQAVEFNIDDANGNNIKFIANGKYDSDNNQLIASADKSNSSGDTQGISLKAKVVPNSNTLTADISEFNLDMFGITCSGNALLDVRPLSETITAPDSEAMEVFKVDKKTVDDAMQSTQKRLTEIINKFSDAKK